MAELKDLSDALIKGDMDTTVTLTKEMIESGVEANVVLQDALIAGMSVVGERFKNNEIYVPEMLIAARAMNAALEYLGPILTEAGVKPIATVVLGTVKGDLHDIGKNLVSIMLSGGGMNVVDIGIDVPAEKFAEAAKEHGAQMVAISALLTTTMPEMAKVLQALKDAGVDAKTVVGGAPVTQNFADEIGADGYAPDAASAVDVAKELLNVA